jgi:stearoyl-CoA desaturase (delta-9 desaturase)
MMELNNNGMGTHLSHQPVAAAAGISAQRLVAWFRKHVLRPSYFVGGLLQVTCGLTFVWALFQGYAWYWWVSAYVAYFFYYCVGMTVGYHRYYAHKSFKARPWAQWLMLTCGMLGGQSSPGSWVVQHIRHHRGADTERDPHWAAKYGWKMLLVWFYPRYQFSGWETRKYLRDPKILLVHKYHNLFVFGWIGSLYLLLGAEGVLFLWAIPYFWNITTSLMMVTAAHFRVPGNYRNFDLKDTSHNVPLLAYLNFGEAWHNNHHRWPGRTNFGIKWWELDIGYYVVKLLSSEKGRRAP